MRFKWESVSQQVDQRRDSLDYALEYLLKRESSINQFGVEVDTRRIMSFFETISVPG